MLYVCFFQAEDGIRDLVRSRGLGDVYKRQFLFLLGMLLVETLSSQCYLQYTYNASGHRIKREYAGGCDNPCLLYTSDAADERSSVDLGGRRIIKKKKKIISL